MSRRPLLTADLWSALLDMPADDESLIRHCTLSRPDLDVIAAKRAAHNRLGLALQICFLRNRGRVLLPGETPPAAMVAFVAEQVGVNPASLAEYGRRATNRREHAVEAQGYLAMRSPVREDRRAALARARAAASGSDKGMPIAQAIIAEYRERRAVLPASDT